ncbi:MAG: segregation/condensation protein A [Thermoanaerobaculia bacterium]
MTTEDSPNPEELEPLNAVAEPMDGEEDEDQPSYSVTLPAFEGPLDLLLHLIKQHKVDIYDIPIMLITEQYNAYLDTMQELDLDIAAEYIYMAALLIHIKSKMLLPRNEDEAESEDPRAELVDRLLEYQRFKAVAESFAEIDVVRMGVWTHPPEKITPDATEIDISEVSLFDLLDAFRTALQRYKKDHPNPIELKRSTHKVSDKMRELVVELGRRSPMRLQWYLEGRDRGELVAIFLGVLELVRLGGISLRQHDVFGEIVIHRTEKEIDEAQFALYDH